MLKSKLKDLLGITRLQIQRDELAKAFKFVPPGHFFSPIVSIDDYLRDEAANLAKPPSAFLGIDFNAPAQVDLLGALSLYWQQDMFPVTPSPGRRYYYPNPAFGSSDAFFLHAMVRHVKPQRLIEVGSGFSSCVILDANEAFFNNQIDLTFIEPYPQLLETLTSKEDLARHLVLPSRLQDIPLETFAALQANDILFIDSTHVSKTNSDVNYLFFEIIPRLKQGVIVHIHDIFRNFDYPKEWIVEGRSWNEAYLFRAFLQYNAHVEIILFNNYLLVEHGEAFRTHLPDLAEHGGGSIWLRIKGSDWPQ